MKLTRLMIILVILLTLGVAAWVPAHGDIHYFSDNARDMLLLQEIATEKPITLIGPRSGIGGVFHGPLWLYINLPAFVLSGGDPAIVGWFWWALYVGGTAAIGWTTARLFGMRSGLLAALFFAFAFRTTGWSQFNANGVLYVMPWWTLALMQYVTGEQGRDTSLATPVWIVATVFFLTGMLIQFQIAFGLPMLVLLVVVVAWRLAALRADRRTLSKHFAASLAILPMISTHIAFDVRHSFLQLRSLIEYALKSEGGTSFTDTLVQRVPTALAELTNWIPGYSLWTSTVLITGIGLIVWRYGNARLRTLAALFSFLYAGFWIVTSVYSGTMWPYYYWGLLPMQFMLIAGALAALPRRTHIWVATAVLIVITTHHIHWFIYDRAHAISPRPISWKFHKAAVGEVFARGDAEFGYYVFEDDLFGYGPKYAFEYWQQRHPEIRAKLNTKRRVTHVYLMPTQSESLSWSGWITNTIKIDAEPQSIQVYPNGVAIYTYNLTTAEQAVSSDPNLLDSLIFR